MAHERDSASKYEPPASLRRIAANRTLAICRAWSAELTWKPVDFMVLAESCYMQGVNDTIHAAIAQGWIPGDQHLTPPSFANEPMD